MYLIRYIKNLFGKNREKQTLNPKVKEYFEEELNQSADVLPPFVYCLIGNIVEDHLFGEEKIKLKGTKQFSPGTKVYCFHPLWGDGYEKIKVIGRPRKSVRFITVITRSEYVVNWRVQKVYHPYLIKLMLKHNGWTDREEDRMKIQELVDSINKNRNGGIEKSESTG